MSYIKIYSKSGGGGGGGGGMASDEDHMEQTSCNHVNTDINNKLILVVAYLKSNMTLICIDSNH